MSDFRPTEPHPVLQLPTPEQARAMGAEIVYRATSGPVSADPPVEPSEASAFKR